MGLHPLIIFVAAIFTHNIALTYLLGMCPMLAISRHLNTAVGMGIAVAAVMTITAAVNWLLLNSGPVLSLALKTKATIPVLWFEKFLSYVTGRTISMGEFTEIGERVFNLERMYNLREGLEADDDTLPARMLNESTFPGVEGGVPLAKMLPKYYKLRGWDEHGVPTPKTLERLSIRA